MSNFNSSSSFDPASGSSLDGGLASTAATQPLSRTVTDTSQQNDSEGSESIGGTNADIQTQCNQTTNNPSKEDPIGEELSHSNEACETNETALGQGMTEELYTISKIAGNEGSSDGAEATAAMVVTGSDGPSENTRINHTAQNAELNSSVSPTNTGTGHGETSNDRGTSETFQVHNETGQDDTADETVHEDTPQDDYAEPSRSIHETIADSASLDIAQDRRRLDEGSRRAKKDAIEHEVREEFRPRMDMLQREMEELGKTIATELNNRQREHQENDIQDNETHEDRIAEEVEEQYRRERESLQYQIDDLAEELIVEVSLRLFQFDVTNPQQEDSQDDDTQETFTEAHAWQTSDASDSENDVEEGNDEAEDEVGDLVLVFEQDIDEKDGDDVDETDEAGTITDEQKAEDEEDEKNATEESSTQPSDEQRTGDAAPASSYEISSETNSADHIGQMTTTIESGDPAAQMIPQQVSADANNTGTLSNDNTNASQKSDDFSNDADCEKSRLNDRDDRTDHDDGDHDAPEAHNSIGISDQQEEHLESKGAESQRNAVDDRKANEPPGGAGSTSPSGKSDAAEEIEGPKSTSSSEEVGTAREAEATGDTASTGGNDDNAPASTSPVNKVPTSTITATTPTGHASQRRIRHHARKAKAKMYGVHEDNGKKGGI